jgi:hypothetical protein
MLLKYGYYISNNEEHLSFEIKAEELLTSKTLPGNKIYKLWIIFSNKIKASPYDLFRPKFKILGRIDFASKRKAKAIYYSIDSFEFTFLMNNDYIYCVI